MLTRCLCFLLLATLASTSPVWAQSINKLLNSKQVNPTTYAQKQLHSLSKAPIQLDTLLTLDHPADRLFVDEEGSIFITDLENARIYKYLKLFEYDSVLYMGGQSLGEEGLLEPVKVATPNRQAVYVFDEGNRNILMLQPNLRVIRSWDFFDITLMTQTGREITINPKSFDVSRTDELFLLNRDDNHVYKIDRFGNYRLDFGGSTYGEGSLQSPDNIFLSRDNKVYVTDTVSQQVSVFDNFGTFTEHLQAPEDFHWQQFAELERYLFYIRRSAPQVLAERRPDGSISRLNLALAPGSFDCYAHSKALYFLQNRTVMRLQLNRLQRP